MLTNDHRPLKKRRFEEMFQDINNLEQCASIKKPVCIYRFEKKNALPPTLLVNTPLFVELSGGGNVVGTIDHKETIEFILKFNKIDEKTMLNSYCILDNSNTQTALSSKKTCTVSTVATDLTNGRCILVDRYSQHILQLDDIYNMNWHKAIVELCVRTPSSNKYSLSCTLRLLECSKQKTPTLIDDLL